LTKCARIWAVVLVSGILSLGLIGCSKQGVTPTASAETPRRSNPGHMKNMWLSETTGKQFRVTVEGDTFRAEWLNVPTVWANHGAFMRTECKRQGSKWVGTTLSYMPWSSKTKTTTKAENWCHLETKFEVDSMTAESISGRGESVKKFDAEKCQILESGTSEFHWSPDR
jgi:hypothetical protein